MWHEKPLIWHLPDLLKISYELPIQDRRRFLFLQNSTSGNCNKGLPVLVYRSVSEA